MTSIVLALSLALAGQCPQGAPQYRLADATGLVWVSCDPAGLSAHVAAVNARLLAPAPQAPASQPQPPAPAPATAKADPIMALANGVDAPAINAQHPGTFTTNDSEFSPYPAGESGHRPRPAPPPEPPRPDYQPLAATGMVLVAAAIVLLTLKRRPAGP